MIITISLIARSYSQNIIKQVSNLHYPEKKWVLTHILVAPKANKISDLAKKYANEAINDPDFDGDYSGGQIDAYRHTIWMAMLTQEINAKKAYKLGVAHEKGNEIDFRKKILEEERLPDSVSCEMDLKNNDVGIEIGKTNLKASHDELKVIVKQAVLSGKCYKIKKDENRNFLDTQGNIIPAKDWLGKWINPKVLVSSDY